MSETLSRRADYGVQLLMDAIDLGSIGLPDIERPFGWDASKAQNLFDSMFRGFSDANRLLWVAVATGLRRARPKHAC